MSVNELCTELLVCEHRANCRDDEFAVLYDACIIRLIQLHKKDLITYREFLETYEIAKRLGIKMPTRSNKIYKRLSKHKNNFQ